MSVRGKNSVATEGLSQIATFHLWPCKAGLPTFIGKVFRAAAAILPEARYDLRSDVFGLTLAAWAPEGG
jgi:hypothetical protein